MTKWPCRLIYTNICDQRSSVTLRRIALKIISPDDMLGGFSMPGRTDAGKNRLRVILYRNLEKLLEKIKDLCLSTILNLLNNNL